jgi:hypothetical protein
LAQRAGKQENLQHRRLVSKALQSLDGYQNRLSEARTEAREIVRSAGKQFPEAVAQLQQQFDSCQFRELRRHVARLQGLLVIDRVSGLTALLDKGDESGGDSGNEPSLEEQSRQCEREITESTGQKTSDTQSALSNFFLGDPAELKSSRKLRESMLKRRVDRLIAKAVAAMPEDPGPLNPQMLAIRSLTTLGDLSPAYLSRFVPYIESLHCLEQVQDQS